MNDNDVKNMLINPYYAINIDPDLATEHEPLTTEAQWVEANLKLIDEIGAHEWLERLLAASREQAHATPTSCPACSASRKRSEGPLGGPYSI
jgi:hypothetical protein